MKTAVKKKRELFPGSPPTSLVVFVLPPIIYKIIIIIIIIIIKLLLLLLFYSDFLSTAWFGNINPIPFRQVVKYY
jgi:hypothetical protein